MATTRDRSIVNAFAVLKSFHHSDELLTRRELSRRANLPRASGYRLIETLVELRALERGTHGRYRQGMMLISVVQNLGIHDNHRVVDDLMGGLDREHDGTRLNPKFGRQPAEVP